MRKPVVTPAPKSLRVTRQQYGFIKRCLAQDEFLRTCLAIKENRTDADGHFIHFLIEWYRREGSVTPADVEDELKTFKEDFRFIVAEAAKTVRRYRPHVEELLKPDFHVLLIPRTESQPDGGSK